MGYKGKCWYSRADDFDRGHCIYLINGEEVKVTNVCSSEDVTSAQKYNSADAVYLGVGTCVKANEKMVKETKDLWIYPEDSIEQQMVKTNKLCKLISDCKNRAQYN